MDNAISRPELLQVADAVAREKNIHRDEVLLALEEAISKAGRARYGNDKDIRATIDRRTGDVRMSRWTEIVELDAIEGVNPARQMTVVAARSFKPDAHVGEYIVDPLPPIDFGRIAAQAAKQVIVQRVREVERKMQFASFRDRVGEIVNAVVKRADFGNYLLDLGGNAEGILHRKELIQRESFKVGDRVRAYIADVREEMKGPQVFLSRVHNGFLAKLFASEVPEIYEGTIEIKAVARDPGSRAKMAVLSRDGSLDPVGACIGRNGSRVKAVIAELAGERVDIIAWTPDIAEFIQNALAPAVISKVIIHEGGREYEIVVPDDQMSLAIGRRGQNVRLAAQLTRCDIKVLTEAQENAKRSEINDRLSKLFIEELDVDQLMAAFLVAEGFETVDDLAATGVDELALIDGIGEDTALQLIDRAYKAIDRRLAARVTTAAAAGAGDDLIALDFLTVEMLVSLATSGITTRDDFADLDTHELRTIVGFEVLTDEDAGAYIMEARAHWFDPAEEVDAAQA